MTSPYPAGPRTSFLWGCMAGALVTAPLLAIFYLGHQILALPLVAFDIFDWLARVLPGSLLTFAIDSLLKFVIALHLGQSSSAAKSAEQTLAMLIMLLAGTLAGGIFFIVRRSRKGFAPGIVLTLIVGVPSALISYRMMHQNTAAVALGLVWILAAFLIWGLTLNWVYLRIAAATDAAGTDASIVRINRRQFMIRVGGTAAVITVAGTTLGRFLNRSGGEPTMQANQWSKNHPLPNAAATVQPVPGTRPELTPLEKHYRIDIDTTPVRIHEAGWKLKVGGLVEEPRELTLDDLRRKYPSTDQFITLSCISNPVGGDLIGTQRWTGVSLQHLLPELRLKQTATHLKISSADGFFETVALNAIKSDERIMLAYAWDGVPLLPEHGFPLRIYVPDLYGMKQPKWILSIDAIDQMQPGYWVERGWDAKAQMQSTSVIDAVAQNGLIKRDGRTFIPVGGIAHAGARGISKVEIRVDNGPWEEAQLRTPLSSLTWVLWRYEWPLQNGQHTFSVRCVDGSGLAQRTDEQPPHPSGANGLHSIQRPIT
jgi:DMSO/TMAO reductase YedYZ molybdopterin-dependent catalytic subunit